MVPAFDDLLARWRAMSHDPKYQSVASAIEDALKLSQKYYDRLNDSIAFPLCTSTYIVICTSSMPDERFCSVLDPRDRGRYIKATWSDESYYIAMNRIESLVCTYLSLICSRFHTYCFVVHLLQERLHGSASFVWSCFQ